MRPLEALELIRRGDIRTSQYAVAVHQLCQEVKKSDFAEEFLEGDGLNEILRIATQRNVNRSLQGHLLKLVVELLVYENALDQVQDSQELVDRIYSILNTPDVPLTASRPTMQILVVLCGILPDGHKMIVNAAELGKSVSFKPFNCFIPLLGSNDLEAVKPTLLLMNLLLKKKKDADEIIDLKNLLFQWKQCGLLTVMQSVSDKDIADPDIKKGLKIFQHLSDFTIPRSWEEAIKYQQKFEKLQEKYDKQNDLLFVYQQQQTKIRLMHQELERAYDTLNIAAACSIKNEVNSNNILSTLHWRMTSTFHPVHRYSEGLTTVDLANTREKAEIDLTRIKDTISSLRKTIFSHITSDPELQLEFKDWVTKNKLQSHTLGKININSFQDEMDISDDELPPPPSDDELPPPSSDDELPPPPSDDEELPPPPSDDEELPAFPHNEKQVENNEKSAPIPVRKSGIPPPLGKSGIPPPLGKSGIPPPLGKSGIPPPLGKSGIPPPPLGKSGLPPPPPLGKSGIPPPPLGKSGLPPPPPLGKSGLPPPLGKSGLPPPGGFGKSAPTPGRLFFKGKPPVKKMKPFHWECGPLPSFNKSIWHRIHDSNEYDCTFNYDEFELMYSQKEAAVVKKVEVKEKKVILLDTKTFQNLSIMLHKLPSIPNIQQAILSLDDTVLSRDVLRSLKDQIPTLETVKLFNTNAETTKKPIEQYEPPEQFIALTQQLPAFKARVTAWLFTMDFQDNTVAVSKPIQKLTEVANLLLQSKYMPYVLGIILGFGNSMNYNNPRKGNAATFSIGTISKLEGTKDNTGKVSLMQHLFTVIKQENPDAFQLYIELQLLLDGVGQYNVADLVKGVTECESSLKLFQQQVDQVRSQIHKQGSDLGDAFIPTMTAFYSKAELSLQRLQEALAHCLEKTKSVEEYFQTNKKTTFEDIVLEFIPFIEKLKKKSMEIEKEKKKVIKKGKKVGNALTDVVGQLQEQIIG